jgi:hypothetical protein
VVSVSSPGLLFTLYLRGRLDTAEDEVASWPAAAGVTGPRSAVIGVPVAVAAGGALDGREPAPPRIRVRPWGTAAVVGLVAGTGLLVFADASWAHLAGVACLVLCAVAVFLLAAPSDA